MSIIAGFILFGYLLDAWVAAAIGVIVGLVEALRGWYLMRRKSK
jgi:hypothetical protein